MTPEHSKKLKVGARVCFNMAARMPPALIRQVEAWAASNDKSRSDAFRHLVGLGLKRKGTKI
jgi:hypothetical protein